MIFNNELSLQDYVVVVEDIAKSFFDENTNRYTPHIGELFAICTYFNYCVKVEDFDEIEHPITDIVKAEALLKNETFVKNFNDATTCVTSRIGLDFGHAYLQALDIVNHNKDGMVYTGNLIAGLLGEFGKRITTAIETMDVDQISKVAESVANGKLTAESIVKAFQGSDRYKEIISGEESTESKVIDFAPKKESDS